jgi:putative protein-disulfide isomerase
MCSVAELKEKQPGKQTAEQTLYYLHDPMCSWCWGFASVWYDLLEKLPADVRVKRVLGGLAADTNEPMPAEMQSTIEATWRRIQDRIPGVIFNFDFWTRCAPRRSTYPSCRAVIAARQQGEEFDTRMTTAVQRAYYTQARNPSDETTLLELAAEIGLDTALFKEAFHSESVQQQLMKEIQASRDLNVSSFPGLVLKAGESEWHIPVDYADSVSMLALIEELRSH